MSFARFLIHGFAFLLISFKSSLRVLGTSLVGFVTCTHCLPDCSVSSHPLNCVGLSSFVLFRFELFTFELFPIHREMFRTEQRVPLSCSLNSKY